MQTSDEPIISDPIPSAPARKGGGRRLLWVTLATLIVAVLVIFGLAAISALGVRRHLVEGRDALTRGKDELIDGDAATARSEFESAHQEFEAAAAGSRSIWLSIVDAIPFVGNTPEAIRAVADAGVQTSEAAGGLAAAVADLPGGLGALAPTRDGIPIDRLSALTDATSRADELT